MNLKNEIHSPQKVSFGKKYFTIRKSIERKAELLYSWGRDLQEQVTTESHGLGVNKALEGKAKAEGVIQKKQVRFLPQICRCLSVTSSV